MRLVFDDQAVADIETIYHRISQDSPSTAKLVIERLFSSIELLISFPLMGHIGRDPATFDGSCRGFLTSSCTRLIRPLSR
jgi:plasmid stabilization system protein ParE